MYDDYYNSRSQNRTIPRSTGRIDMTWWPGKDLTGVDGMGRLSGIWRGIMSALKGKICHIARLNEA
jgi:hypothetical protein